MGAVITYNLKDGYRTRAQERQQPSARPSQRGETPPYPTPEMLRAESEEEPPAILMTVTDASGKVVRRMEAPATAGIHRVTWDLRGQSPNAAGGRGGLAAVQERAVVEEPVRGRGGAGAGGEGGAGGGGEEDRPHSPVAAAAAAPLVVPGKYTVALAKRVNGVMTPLPGSQAFEVVAKALPQAKIAWPSPHFRRKAEKLQQALTASQDSVTEARTRLDAIRRAVDSHALPCRPNCTSRRWRCEKQPRRDRLGPAAAIRIWRAHQRRYAGIHFGARAGGRFASTRNHRTSNQDRYRAVPDRVRRVSRADSQAPQADGDDIKALEKQLDAAGGSTARCRTLPRLEAG